MTTSRIYAYRWPARLVSHKPFAAERYSITSSCIWQVFFRKNADFLFYLLRFLFRPIFCAECTIGRQLFPWKTPPTPVCPVFRGRALPIIQQKRPPGWFKAAPCKGSVFLVHPALQALGLSCAQPPAHKAVVLQSKPAAPSASSSSTDRVVVLKLVTNWICSTPAPAGPPAPAGYHGAGRPDCRSSPAGCCPAAGRQRAGGHPPASPHGGRGTRSHLTGLLAGAFGAFGSSGSG